MADGRKANGRWVDRWREGGRHRQATFHRKGDRDAFKRERLRRQQLGGLVRLEQPVQLAAFMEDYWRLHAIPNLEPKTREVYLQHWGRHIRPRLGEYELRSVTPALINRQLVAPMRRDNVGDPTLLKTLTVLQAIFAYALADDRVDENPVRKVTRPRQVVGREVSPVPPAMVERLRARLGARDATMVAVLAYAGLRPGELLALTWEDVSDDAIWVRRKNVNGQLFGYTKTRTNRRVKLLARRRPDRVGACQRPAHRADLPRH